MSRVLKICGREFATISHTIIILKPNLKRTNAQNWLHSFIPFDFGHYRMFGHVASRTDNHCADRNRYKRCASPADRDRSRNPAPIRTATRAVTPTALPSFMPLTPEPCRRNLVLRCTTSHSAREMEKRSNWTFTLPVNQSAPHLRYLRISMVTEPTRVMFITWKICSRRAMPSHQSVTGMLRVQAAGADRRMRNVPFVFCAPMPASWAWMEQRWVHTAVVMEVIWLQCSE